MQQKKKLLKIIRSQKFVNVKAAENIIVKTDIQSMTKFNNNMNVEKKFLPDEEIFKDLKSFMKVYLCTWKTEINVKMTNDNNFHMNGSCPKG